eukprot:4707968-Pleurochrysis_carterae.AAC.1
MTAVSVFCVRRATSVGLISSFFIRALPVPVMLWLHLPADVSSTIRLCRGDIDGMMWTALMRTACDTA